MLMAWGFDHCLRVVKKSKSVFLRVSTKERLHDSPCDLGDPGPEVFAGRKLI